MFKGLWSIELVHYIQHKKIWENQALNTCGWITVFHRLCSPVVSALRALSSQAAAGEEMQLVNLWRALWLCDWEQSWWRPGAWTLEPGAWTLEPEAAEAAAVIRHNPDQIDEVWDETWTGRYHTVAVSKILHSSVPTYYTGTCLYLHQYHRILTSKQQ